MARRRTVIERPKAQLDVIQQAMHLMLESPSAAERFVSAVELEYRRLLQFPRVGRRFESSIHNTKGLRFRRLKRFPNWLIFYMEFSGGIEIVRVLHGARDIPPILTDEFFRDE